MRTEAQSFSAAQGAGTFPGLCSSVFCVLSLGVVGVPCCGAFAESVFRPLLGYIHVCDLGFRGGARPLQLHDRPPHHPVFRRPMFVAPSFGLKTPQTLESAVLSPLRWRVFICRPTPRLAPRPPRRCRRGSPPTIRGKEKLQAVRAEKTVAADPKAKEGGPGRRDGAREADEEKEEAARSEMLEINDFLFRAGLDNVNLFKLQRYMRRSEISRKVRSVGYWRKDSARGSQSKRWRWRGSFGNRKGKGRF